MIWPRTAKDRRSADLTANDRNALRQSHRLQSFVVSRHALQLHLGFCLSSTAHHRPGGTHLHEPEVWRTTKFRGSLTTPLTALCSLGTFLFSHHICLPICTLNVFALSVCWVFNWINHFSLRSRYHSGTIYQAQYTLYVYIHYVYTLDNLVSDPEIWRSSIMAIP